MTINLNDLSVELLLSVFQYCNIKDLCRLKQSCKRFNLIINTYKIVTENQNTLVTNQIQSAIKNRSLTILNAFDKWRISYNWKKGRYKFYGLLKQREKLMPWISLDRQYFWVSHGRYVKAFFRKLHNVINEHSPVHVLHNTAVEDVVRFKVKENFVISGLREGGVWIWSKDENKLILNNSQSHAEDVTDVDLTQTIYVTSSSDRSYSIWPLNENSDTILQSLYTNSLDDKIWSISISPSNKYLAVGSAGFNSVPPFHIFDLERNIPILGLPQQYLYGAGVLDLHWENDNTVMTCGYDTYLKKWDLRTGRIVQRWGDPHDSTLYCLASDDLYTVCTGTSSYGTAVLWDQRIDDKYIQLYFTCSPYKNSPIYSIGFDACQLFVALDQNVACLDFTNSHGRVRNYEAKIFGSII